MSIRKVFRLVSSVSFVGVAIWACSSGGPNTGFGNTGGGNTGGNNTNNNGGSSNTGGNNTYGGGGNNTTNNNNNTSNGGFGNTSNNNGGSTRTTGASSAGGSTATGGGTGCPAQTGAYSTSTSCTATKASSALTLANCFYTSANPTTMGQGYGYVFGDGTSTVCLDSTALCGSGMTAKADAAFTLYGSGFGVNLNQSSGGTAAGTIKPTATGLTWALSEAVAPMYGLQIVIIGDTGPCATSSGCCFRPTTTSGTTPWSSFTTACYNPAEAGAGFQASDGIDKINFQAISSTMGAAPFDFCVTALSY